MVSLRDQTILALRQQVAELVKERDEARDEVTRLRVVEDLALRTAHERDRLKALLREVEWEGQDGCCPVCGDEEHHAACGLKAALEGRDG